MRVILLFLLLLSLVFPGGGQPIRVRMPYQVDGSYNYSFIQDDKYIIGTPYGSRLLSNMGKFCLWDAKTGKFIHGFDNGVPGNYPHTFSPDGRWYAVQLGGDQLFFGDVARDEFIDSLPFHPVIQLSQDLRISPDGKFAVYDSAFSAGTTIIYDVPRKQRHSIKDYFDVRLTRFSKGSRTLCLVTYGSTVKIFDLPDLKPVMELPLPKEINKQNIGLGLGFFPQDSLLQVIDDSTMYLVPMTTREVVKIPHIEATLWLRNGTLAYIATTAGKRQLVAYDVSAGKKTVLAELAGRRVDLSAAGDLVVLRDETDFSAISYSVFDKSTQKLRWVLGPKIDGEPIIQVTFPPSGKYYVAETSQAFRVYETEGRKLLKRLPRQGQGFQTTAVFFSADERKLGIKDGTTVRIHHLPGGLGETILQNGGNNQNYTVMGFSPDSKAIAINTYSKGIVNFVLDSVYVDPGPPGYNGDHYSPDHRYFLRSNSFSDLSLYDATKNTEIRHFTLDVSGFSNMFSPKGNYFAVYDAIPNKVYLFETKTGKQLWVKELNLDFMSADLLSFDANDRVLIAGSQDAYNVFDLPGGNPLGQVPRQGLITKPVIDASSTWMYVADSSGNLRSYNLRSGMKRENNRPATDPAIKAVHYTIFSDSMQCVRVGDFGAGKFTDRFCRLAQPAHYDRGSFFARESPDHRFLLVYYSGDSIEVWDLQKKQVSSVIAINHIQVADVFISPDDRWIAVEGKQKELYLFDRPANLFKGAFYFFSNGYFLHSAYIDNEGYYKADRKMANDLRFSIAGVTYDFDQLDLRFNRPDIVLQGMGCRDTGLIRSYHQAWLNRLRNMGLDTTRVLADLEAPTAEVVNEIALEDNPAVESEVSLKIHVRVGKATRLLERLFITANGNPVFGSAGQDLAPLRTRDTTLFVRVGLAPGSNQLKISCLDDEGVESYRTPVNIDYLPAKAETPHTWFVGIGVSHYKNLADSLKYPLSSIRGVDSLFSPLGPAHYSHLLLLDSEALKENILAIRQRLLKDARPDDRVILALSGHGIVAPSGAGRQFFFGTEDIDFRKPGLRGISYDSIAWLLDGVPAQKKLILIDACAAGALDVSGTNSAGFELMQELFSNTSRGNGATVIAASAGDKRAFEPAGLGNSYLMYYVLKGLREGTGEPDGDGSVRVQQLLQYLIDRVGAETGNIQKPGSRLVNYDNNWIVSPSRIN